MSNKDEVIFLLESGVLNTKCNLKGNYANLCRAVVNKTHGIEGWDFSSEFKDVLGIDLSVGAHRTMGT